MPSSASDVPAHRTLTVSALHVRDGAAVVPWLRLSGHWLRRAGFEPGTKYIVTIEHGRLVLEVRRPDPSTRGATP